MSRPSSTSPSGPSASRTAGTWRVGITSTWTGALASMSWKARASAERFTTLAGISPATILQKRQSAMRPPKSGGAHQRGRRQRGRLESEGVRRQRHRLEAGAASAARSCSLSPPSGPITTVTGPPSSAAGAAPPPGSASQRVPDGGRSANSVSSSGADTSVTHAAPHCLTASSARRRSRTKCWSSQPRGDPAGALGLERHDPGDAELDGLLDHPREALPVPRSHRQRKLRRTRACARRSPHPLPSCGRRPPGALCPTRPAPSRSPTCSPGRARRTRR